MISELHNGRERHQKNNICCSQKGKYQMLKHDRTILTCRVLHELSYNNKFYEMSASGIKLWCGLRNLLEGVS